MARADVTAAFILVSSIAILASEQVSDHQHFLRCPSNEVGTFRRRLASTGWNDTSRGTRLLGNVDRPGRFWTA